jgi:hypothetical protein
LLKCFFGLEFAEEDHSKGIELVGRFHPNQQILLAAENLLSLRGLVDRIALANEGPFDERSLCKESPTTEPGERCCLLGAISFGITWLMRAHLTGS